MEHSVLSVLMMVLGLALGVYSMKTEHYPLELTKQAKVKQQGGTWKAVTKTYSNHWIIFVVKIKNV